MPEAPRITVNELQQRLSAGEEFTILDSRNPQAWAESDTKIPGAIRVPVDKLDQNISRISKNKPIVIYCT